MLRIVKLTILFLGVMALSLAGCKKGDGPSVPADIDPDTQPSELSRAIKVKNGVNKNGAPPAHNTSTNLLITKFQPSALITADNFLFVPLVGQSTETVNSIYFQIVGADNYWVINEGLNTDKTQVLNIEVPANVLNGKFEMIYGLRGASGAIGEPVNLKVEVMSPVEYCANSQPINWIEGRDGLVSYSFSFGKKVGWITIDYDTYTVPDRIDIRYNKQWVASTGALLNGNAPRTKLCSAVSSGDGFVGRTNSFKIYYDGNISTKLDVYVSGCLEGGTQWKFKIRECPENWYTGLPDCPCVYNASIDKTVESGGTWRDFSGGCIGVSFLDKYHYGATYELRWAMSENVPGQQCTYGSDKRLITSGIAAGSPDHFGILAPCDRNTQHETADVKTWETEPCWEYLRDWPSNNGNSCRENKVSPIDHMLKMIGNMTCEEATFLIRKAKESPNLLIDAELRNYIIGVSVNLTKEQLISKLTNWKNLNSCQLFPSDRICVLIDKAIANLKL